MENCYRLKVWVRGGKQKFQKLCYKTYSIKTTWLRIIMINNKNLFAYQPKRFLKQNSGYRQLVMVTKNPVIDNNYRYLKKVPSLIMVINSQKEIRQK